MEILNVIKDSVETSVVLKLFKTEKDSAYAHVFHSNYMSFPMSQCRDLDNFNPARLSSDPYPKEDRPRGKKDLESILYHRKLIRREGLVEQPIWVALKNDRYILLDGAHRIVATYMENKRTIHAYVVNIN